ncbi:hypothetical protein FIBSPDRAFT_884276 [Athelia psychrophila]|uniref:Uncharacterized protein n=1 Tax=Athelia psychrophila TaxID=1759441 RepID=A0A166T930_9AGAM|nr:hypothetical protein FIBSPDRAFT_884276 [Fibularhizoctonia sp. CBS 109695]
MLTTFSKNWTKERILPAWREYCKQMFREFAVLPPTADLQSGREEGAMPWKRVSANVQGIVTITEGGSVNCEQPSRLTYKQLKDNWESCPKNKLEHTLATHRRPHVMGIPTNSDAGEGKGTSGEDGEAESDKEVETSTRWHLRMHGVLYRAYRKHQT